MRTHNPYPAVPLLLLAALLFMVVNAHAQGVLEAPHHNVTSPSIVGCLDCHDLTALGWPKFIPEPPGYIPRSTTVLENENTIFNLKCWECHSGSTVTAGESPVTLQNMATHSSLEMGSTRYGEWAAGCTVCHNAHSQGGQPGGRFIWNFARLDQIEVYGGKTAKSGRKPVVFNGPTGPKSFADGDATYDGICEVCHTETNYHRNDSTGDHTHYVGQHCTNCHPHDGGFQPGTVCLDCHTGSVNARTAIGLQFSANSHHIQGVGLSSEQCYQCHWEADINGEPTIYHTPEISGSTVDLVIRDSNDDGSADPRPAGYMLGTTAMQYTAGTTPPLDLNPHCLGCHNDDYNNFAAGGGIFGDGKAPNQYAWDGSSVDARYSQTGVARWGKYYNTGGNQNAVNAAEKDIGKAFSAHGNAENNYGGGYSTVPSCFGTDITNQTCPDLGGVWNPASSQCDNISLSQCTQGYCLNLTQQTCEGAAGIWGTNSSICTNISQYTCATGYCYMNTGNYNDYNDWLCNDRGGTYREVADGWICTDITSGQCSGIGWVSMSGVGSWHTINSKYMQGVDYALIPTRGGSSAVNVACFDCHNSHGSNVVGSNDEINTTSYLSATPSGGILKDTTAGKGGYSISYKPEAGGSTATRNQHKAGAALCLNCHLTSTADIEADDTPWSYDASFGAEAPIIGYFDSEYLEPGEAGPQKLFAYKALSQNAGGHFDASKPLISTPMHDINGICTPCHDPHGVSPTHVGSCDPPYSNYVTKPDCINGGGNWTVGQEYGIPLLKGTWLTSPYREDAAPDKTNLPAGWSGNYVRSTPGYHIDQNTFADWDFFSTAAITEDVNIFAGLCLQCHLQDEINPNADNSWNTMDRIHNTVKGWDDYDGVESLQTKHMFPCSKCHTPHNGSVLPRLMTTNCLNFRHRGQVGSGGYPNSGNYANVASGDGGGGEGSGSGKFPGGGSGNGTGDWDGIVNFKYGFAGAACHDNVGNGSWPDSQLWNQVTPWSDLVPELISPTATGVSSTAATLGAEILTGTGWDISERGTVWGTAPNPTGNKAAEGAAIGAFSHERTNLPAGTKVFYRGYAINNNGTGYSPQGSFYTEPEFQASAINFTTITPTSMTVNWTRNVSGGGVIVIMKQGSVVDTDPADGIYSGYNWSTAFGSGTEIGAGNYVVFKGDGSSVNVTGLYPGTSYHVAVYEYAGNVDTTGTDQGTNYKTPPVAGSSTTITAPPVLASPTATAITSETADIGANLLSTGGPAVSERGTVWGTTPAPIINEAAEGGTTTGVFSHGRTGLDSGTKIYYRGYAVNSEGTGYSPDGSFYTEPSTQASAINLSPASSTTATLTWSRGDGNGVIVLMKMFSPVDVDPDDGTYSAYTANASFGAGTQIGSGNYVVYKGSGTSVTVSGLYLGTTYHVAVYEYAGAVDNAGVHQGTNYRQHDVQKASGTISIPSGDYTYSFDYTGSPQTVYIPAAATNIQFTLGGGGGGGGRFADYMDQTPGEEGHLVVTTGTETDAILTIYVGSGGKKAPTTDSGAPGGWGYPSGQAGFPGDNSYGGAGGGGASAIYIDATRLAEAAGGKGGNSDDWSFGGDAGSGGAGGAGGGTDIGENQYTTGGGTGGAAPDNGTPADGGDGQVLINFTIP